jgi:hypothetical protein
MDKDEQIYNLKKANVALKMRLVKIMLILENTKNLMEKSKDAIVKELANTETEISLE